MDIQRVRNLTTGRLHTSMDCIYQDFEFLTGKSGIMTHMLPNAARAIKPYLQKHVKDEKFWEDVYDTSHIGEIDVPPMDDGERAEFWKRYGELPSPFAGLGA